MANRRNALKSTGPKSAAGKARSARNAHRHGLSIPIDNVPQLAGDAEDLALLIAGSKPSAERLARARAVAEAEIDIRRIREVRVVLLTDPAAPASDLSPEQSLLRLRALVEVDSLLAAKFGEGSAARKPQKIVGPSSDKAVEEPVSSGLPSSPERLVIVLPRLLRLDRYETRARARRHKAVQAFQATQSGGDFK